MSVMHQAKQLPRVTQTKVLWLHQQAFNNSPCQKCKGECCRMCAESRGYIGYGMKEKEWAAFAEKYQFDKNKGFQGESGCSLPVTERAHVCLGFICASPTTGKAFGFGRSTPNLGYFTKQQMEAQQELRKEWYAAEAANAA